MKTFRKILIAVGLVAFAFIVYTSCKKEASNSVPQGQQRVQVRLSDDPVNFDAVFVDIQRVEVQVIPDSCLNRSDDDHDHDGDDDHNPGHDSRCSVWDTLNIRPGIYNLLNLANGTDTLLASGFTTSGKISKIRLTLGSNNSVVIDSVSYPLTLWNNDHQITISVRGEDVDQISPVNLQFWLDFDAARSIVRVSNNHFVLRPFLRIWLPAHTASISGRVLPESARSVVSAITNGDTLIAIPDHDDGRFKIRGLTASSANVFINTTANGYQDTTINNVSLTAGRNTDIGTIQLHH
jgi:hypothetical protein